MRSTVATCLLLILTPAWLAATDTEPQSPEASLRAPHVRPGFTVELVAAEPLVRDPVAFDWGPDGKLWVVEMGDYPLGLDNRGKPGGRVRFLEDTDGDGRYDRATPFLDGLLHPTGVLAWRNGVLVTCAPEIFYAADTDGDGRADRREVLFTGFGEVNPQHRVNGLRWGLDNWVYCANGDFAPVRARGAAPAGPAAQGTPFNKEEDVRRLVFSGAAVRSVKTGVVFDIRNRDFRIRPDEGLLDPQTGQAQFGRDRDDWGNWFGCNHAVPLWHFALDEHYLRRNPHVAAPNPRGEVSRAVTFPRGAAGRDTGSVRRGQGNPFTSACGIAVYRDELFGPEFAGSWFVCEPVHNLVHREILSADGTTFSSRRPASEERSEFLSSSDTWFSPVMARTGPDGALWVADMYRKVLEHPNWLPAGWERKVDVRAGDDRGQIYRVYPTDKKPRPIPRLDRLDTAGLVAALDSPNGWQRDTAQRLLVQRRDLAAVPLLEKQAAASERASCRLHALCTLDGLGALRPALLARALADPHPGVRRHAVRLCEAALRVEPGGSLSVEFVKRVADPDAPVRLQVAYTLGEWDDPRAGRALGELMVRDARDPYLSAAAMSSVTVNNLDQVVAAALAGYRNGTPPVQLMDNLLRSATGFGKHRATAVLLNRVSAAENGQYAPWQFAVLERFLDALSQRNASLAKLGEAGGVEMKTVRTQLAGMFAAARATLADPRASREEQLQAIRLLGRGPDRHAEDFAKLAGFLVPQTPAELQAAAVAALGQLREPRVADVLVRGWKGYGPGLRSQVLDVLLGRPEWVKALLDAVENGPVLAAEIDAARRQRLLEQPATAVRERAARLFAGHLNPDRQKVVESFRSALSLKADPKRGAQLFAKHCAACHRLGTVGQPVGPDLAMVRDKPPEWFLPALFDPNQAVEARYVNYLAVTKNGVSVTGVLTAESGNGITLVGPDGKAHVLLRGDLDELSSSGKSAKPEGLEKDLKPQDVADLIALLRSR